MKRFAPLGLGLILSLIVLVAATHAQAGGSVPTLYSIDAGGTLMWNAHLGHAAGAVNWRSVSNRVVGSGWGGFKHVFAGGHGSVYAVRANGELAEYLHTGRANGTPSWNGPKVVGSGWHDARLIFTARGGVIYAIMTNGDLRWYKHLGQASLTPQWTGGHPVGSGWGGFDLVIAAPNGVIYARKPNGQLLYYRHTGQATGAATWGPGSGNVVGSNGFRAMAAGPDGVLYGLQPNGDLLWYQHLGATDGTARWAGGGTGKKIGSGWMYKHLFAPPPGDGSAPQPVQWRTLAGQAIHCGPGGCLSSGPGCDTQAVPGQCSFPRAKAQELCAQNPECKALTCNGGRSDCQARRVDKPSALNGFTSYVKESGAPPPSPPAPAETPVASTTATPPPASFDAALISKIQQDPGAAFLPMFMGRPEVKSQLTGPLAAVAQANGTLAAAVRKLAGLAKDGNVLGRWKTKQVCVPKSVTVKGSCKAYAQTCSSWGAPSCSSQCAKRVLGACVWWKKVNCKSPCRSWRSTGTCILWWPDSVTTRNACSNVRYFDPTEGSLFKEARRAAEQKLAEARRRLEEAKNNLVAQGRRTFATLKSSVTKFASESWKSLEAAAKDLWAKAGAGALALYRRIFEFAGNAAVTLLDPLFAKAAQASLRAPAPMSRVASAGFLPALRRIASAQACQAKPIELVDCSLYADADGKACPSEYERRGPCTCGLKSRESTLQSPVRQLRSYITQGAKRGLDLIKSVFGSKGTWSKLVGVAEVARWKMISLDYVPGPKATWINKAGNFLAKWTGLKFLFEKGSQYLEKYKELKKKLVQIMKDAWDKAWASSPSSAKSPPGPLEQWADEMLESIRKGGKRLAAFLDDLARGADLQFAAYLRKTARSFPEGAFVKNLDALGKLLTPRPGFSGASRELAKKLAKGWAMAKTAAAPVLARMASSIKAAAAGASSAAKQAGSKIASLAKKIGLGPVLVTLQWVAVGAAYPYADFECQSAAGVDTDCGRYSEADRKSCPAGYVRTAACTCVRRDTTEARYRTCYVEKFKQFTKQAFFDALVGTAVELLELPVLTPMAVGVTAAVAAAVALAFTPATAATAGAVVGMATKIAASVLMTIYADHLMPWYEKTIWKASMKYWDEKANEGADVYWGGARDPSRLVDESKNAGGPGKCKVDTDCNFERACSSAGYCYDQK